MRIAVVHDWLVTWRGGERVLAEIMRAFPGATLFALVDFLSEADRQRLGGARARTSFLQHLPAARRHFRRYLPLFPRAIESLDVSGYDIVISSSHAFAKGVRTRPQQLHVSYCYTPMRYAWDMQEQYLEQTGLARGVRGVLARRMLARLRRWDRATSARVSHFVAASDYVARRIASAYGREADVIYPPVAIAPGLPRAAPGPHYVTVSALVPYKRVDLLVEAFRGLPDRALAIIGEGPERPRLERDAPANVTFLGNVADATRDHWVGSARGFVFAAEEDFGIAPLEAQGLGVPVIALARGGTLETIHALENAAVPTGVLFAEQSAAAIRGAILEFEANAGRFLPAACRENAARFDPPQFRAAFARFVEQAWHRRIAGHPGEADTRARDASPEACRGAQ